MTISRQETSRQRISQRISLQRFCHIAFLAGLLALPASLAAADRSDLDASTLRKGKPTGLAENYWFLPGADAKPALQDFTGTLVLQEAEMGTNPAKFTSRKVLGKDPKIFPAVRLSFFTYKGDLVPVTQDVIRAGSTPAGHSFWDIIVQPGQVWSEPGDGGWSRAAFPFSLVHSVEGETHNGIATFLYRGGKVSNLRFQVVQQTAPYYIVDYFSAWGSAPGPQARRAAQPHRVESGLRCESRQPRADQELGRSRRQGRRRQAGEFRQRHAGRRDPDQRPL
ncbi:MAG: hypothetical protein E6Q98_11770 [Rhodospirillaceae bacterium]|nr:MAG: hypothetical protein E6Q98_11770 [Rhodospirillaceae bacterium]